MEKIGPRKPFIQGGTAKTTILLGLFFIVILASSSGGVYLWRQNRIDELDERVSELTIQLDTAKKQNEQNIEDYTSENGVKIKVYSPQSNQKVNSPLTIVGEVPGNWSFEASFPVQLLNSDGNIVASTPARLHGDWMTDQPSPFTATLEYQTTPTGSGTLVLKKDNPSGLEQNDDRLTIPVKF